MKSFNVRENITAELKRPSKDSALYTGSILEEDDDDDDDHFQPDIDSIIIIFIIWNLCVVEKKESFERRSKSNIQGYIIV
jgi:hypothetical protein